MVSGVEEHLEEADAPNAVGQHMVSPQVHRRLAVFELGKQRDVPRRAISVERGGIEQRDHAEQLPERSGRRQLGRSDMLGGVDLKVFDPRRSNVGERRVVRSTPQPWGASDGCRDVGDQLLFFGTPVENHQGSDRQSTGRVLARSPHDRLEWIQSRSTQDEAPVVLRLFCLSWTVGRITHDG